MISAILTVIGSFIYISLHWFLSYMKTSDGSLEYKKSNQFSTFIYFCGVACFIYKFNKQHSGASNGLIHSLVSVMGCIITLDIMVTVIWGKIECLMLEVLPDFMHKVLNNIGYDFESDLPFVLLLWGISFSCAMVAYRSDSLLEIFFKLSHEDEVTDCPSIQTLELHSESVTDIEDDEADRASVPISEVHHKDPRFSERTGIIYREVPINYRGVNTLPSDFISPPPRRSLRCRSRQCVFDHQK